MSPALIFDCDGVLADTERHGHLPAFNAAFAEAGLPVRWTPEEYARLVLIGGGKERLRACVTPQWLHAQGMASGDAEVERLVTDLHRSKTRHYVRLVESGALPPRPGVARLVAQARAAGWSLAVASTSAEVSVRAVLVGAVGAELASAFRVFAGDVVRAKKPDPAVYRLALEELGLGQEPAIAVEDSANGLSAALGAGVPTVVTVSHYTAQEDFTGACLVVSTLGQVPESPTDVLANPYGIAVGEEVRLGHLEELLRHVRGASTR